MFDTIYIIFIILLTREALVLIGRVTSSDRLREIRRGRGYASRVSGAGTKKKLNVSTAARCDGSGERGTETQAFVSEIRSSLGVGQVVARACLC